MSKAPIKKITICGFGLIGGCMALDFLKSRANFKLFAYDRPNVLKRLTRQKRFKVNCESNFSKAVSDADIIVLSAPHKANEQMLTQLAKMKSLENCLIIDTGAVKQPIAKLASRQTFGQGTQFLPSHPMAGKEKAGFENSDAQLFNNHSWFLDESIKLNPVNNAKLKWMTRQLGTKPTYIPNRLHDELMSEISHLPQLISTVLG
ncbi:MAG TPA: prephenate dehydrogenase/arogenate dehydrogenase family protein, partial [candidate division Zixibacteria bacterium]|nr:prephenate dehydrogenase/arogenate dehydrogenase family protein [candidate division Zixibacteria bacterium]